MDGSTRGGENHEAKKLVASRTVSRDKGGKEGQQDQSDLALQLWFQQPTEETATLPTCSSSSSSNGSFGHF